jgi:hypothetical protein
MKPWVSRLFYLSAFYDGILGCVFIIEVINKVQHQ